MTGFPVSLKDEQHTLLNLKGGSKTQNGRFSSKSALNKKKVCYSFFV